jgi:hypothetical protein
LAWRQGVSLVNINAEELCSSLLERARRSGKLEQWIQAAIIFIQRQDLALRDCRDGLREQLGAAARADVLEKEIRRLQKALAFDTPWPIQDVLTALISATEHLQDVHGCEHDGFRVAIEGGKTILDRLTLKPTEPSA